MSARYLGKSQSQSQKVSPNEPAGYTIKKVAGNTNTKKSQSPLIPASLYQSWDIKRSNSANISEPETTQNQPPHQ